MWAFPEWMQTRRRQRAHHRILEAFRTGSTDCFWGHSLWPRSWFFKCDHVRSDWCRSHPNFTWFSFCWACMLITHIGGRGVGHKQDMYWCKHDTPMILCLSYLLRNILKTRSSLLPTRSLSRGLLSYPPQKMVLIVWRWRSGSGSGRSGKVAGLMRQLSRNAKIYPSWDAMAPLSKLVGRYRCKYAQRNQQ